MQDYAFKKSKQILTLRTRYSIKITGKSVQVDLQLLFQRLVAFAVALFEASSVPLPINKH